jgi:diacylglycerol kinase family enzyme
MDLVFFAETLAEICAHSLAAPGRELRWFVIANPAAGGFRIASRWNRHFRVLREYRQKALANPLRKGAGEEEAAKRAGGGKGLALSEGPGSARRIAEILIEEADRKSGPFYLVITAGGDGTSLDVLSAMYRSPAHIRGNMAVLRLPMGTGNDGADCAELSGALDLLVKPSLPDFAPAVRLVTAPGGPAAGKGPFMAFNILSVGLDAFVTHMTNKMKGKLPGDSYKLWVDIAALLYDRIYTVDYMDVRALDETQREIRAFREKVLLLAVGASGRRTYGSHKKILPDERNVCVVRQMPLLRKLALKGQFTTGTHIDKPETMLCTARRIEFSGKHPLLAQMDGETVLLTPDDFPASIELTAPVIPFLRLKER